MSFKRFPRKIIHFLVSDFDLSYLYTDLQSKPYLRSFDTEDYQHILNLYVHLVEKYERKDNLFKRKVIKYSLLSVMYEFCIIDNKNSHAD